MLSVYTVGTQIVAGYGTDDTVYKNETVTYTKHGNKTTELKTKGGYESGYIYKSTDVETEAGIKTIKLKSASDAKGYEQLMKDISGGVSYIEQCVNATRKTAEKTENGGWRVEYSEFVGVSKKDIGDALGFTSLFTTADEYDLTVVLTVAPNLYPEKIDINVDVKEGSAAAETLGLEIRNCSMTFKDFNNTTTSRVNLDDYKTCDDVGVIDRMKKGLDDLNKSKSGTFEASVHLISVNGYKRNEKQETDKVSYSTDENGVIRYEVDAVIDGKNSFTEFDGGSYRVYDQKGGECLGSMSLDPAVAEALMRSMNNKACYDPTYVCDVDYDADANVYVITLLEHAALRNSCVGSRYEYADANKTYTIRVSIDGCKLLSVSINHTMLLGQTTYTLIGEYKHISDEGLSEE